MDEQQQEEYFKFIHNLSICKPGTEATVYQDYSHLVDEILPAVMVIYAEYWEQADEPQDMTWLRQESAILTAKIDNWQQLHSQGLALDALELACETFPSPNNYIALSLNDLARSHQSLGQWAEAEPLFERALVICEELCGDRPNRNLACSLNNLGRLYYLQGRWAEVEPLWNRALAICRELCEDLPDEDLASSLNSLGALYTSQGRWEDAEPLLERSLAIREELCGDCPDEDLASSLHNVGALYQSQGRWEAAEPLLERALTICEELCGDRPNEHLADSLNNLGALYKSQGRLAEAEPLFKRALTIREDLCGDCPDEYLANSLNSLGALYNSQGRWAEAEPLYQGALTIREDLCGDRPHSGLAVSLNNLGEFYKSQGRWAEAEPLFDRGLAICEELFGERPNNDLAASLSDLAALYRLQGRWAEAESLSHRALAIRQELFGDRLTEDLAVSLNDLASVYELQGRWAEAEPLYERALAIREELCGNRPTSNLAVSLNNLASLYKSQGRWAAEPLFLRSLAIGQELFGNRPTKNQATSLSNLAKFYTSQGRWAEAKPLFEQALAIREELFGDTGHPALVDSLLGLAEFHARQQQPDKALLLLQQTIESENLWFTNILPATDRQQRLQDLAQVYYHLELLLSLTQQYFPTDATAVTAALNAVLSRKAQATATEAALNQAIQQKPELAPDLLQLKACQQEITALSYAIANQPELKDRLNSLLQQRRELEKKLARSIPVIDLAQQVVDRQALTSLLPPDAFLVEFVRYRPFDFIQDEWQPARYLVFVVPPNTAEGVTAIDCGVADELDRAIDKFRRAYADIDFSGEHSGFKDMLSNPLPLNDRKKFSPECLDRLLPHLPTTGTCYLATDSHLQLLPFHLIETAEGEYLGDRYRLHHLTTARDLLRHRIPSSDNPPLILADPDYDGGNVPISTIHSKTGLQVSDRLDGQRFDRLLINRQFGERIAKSYRVTCYTDIAATVDRLERINAPRLLFIATHGFSLPAQNDLIETIQNCAEGEESAILRKRSSELTPEFRAFWQQYADAGSLWCQRIITKIDEIDINLQSTDLLSQPIDDPMLRSGIALAGANIWRFQGTSDSKFGKGVVFADDITQWNLWGTELSVLVTCVSGLGAVSNSEGVFGLRRALAIAGAKYVISSLWNIPTKPSVLLMNKFFEIYQSSAKPTPAVALAHSQSYIRQITLGELKQSAIGLEIVKELLEVRVLSSISTDDVKPLADPYFWGAWICQG